MKDWTNWALGMAITAFVIWLILDVLSPKNREPDICSLEYRDAYLQTHDNDDELRKVCSFEPWHRTQAKPN